MSRIFFVLAFIPMVCFAACDDEFAQWRAKFAGVTPYASLVKTSPDWAPKADRLAAILGGNRTVPLTVPLAGGKMKEIDVGLIREDKETFARSSAMITEAQRCIKATQERTLLIIDLGARHGFQLYLDDASSKDTLYATHPYNAKTTVRNEVNRFIKEWKGVETPENSNAHGGQALHLNALGQVVYYSEVQKKPFSVEQLLDQGDVKKPRVLVLLDTHGIDEEELMNSLPSAACLKELGYDNVDVLTEMISRTSASPAKDFVEKVKLRHIITPENMKELTTLRPDLAARLDQIRIFPSQHALIRKLYEYQNAQIPIRILGLDL